jgi:predicted choloylglycine hydrolase
VDCLSHVGETKLNCGMSQNYLKIDNFLPLKSGNSMYVTKLGKSNLIANGFSNVYQSHDFNVSTFHFPLSTAETEAVEISIDVIRNSVIERTLMYWFLQQR